MLWRHRPDTTILLCRMRTKSKQNTCQIQHEISRKTIFKKTQNIRQNPHENCRTRCSKYRRLFESFFLAKMFPDRSPRGPLESSWAPLVHLLGASWAPLGLLLGPLGRLLRPLGTPNSPKGSPKASQRPSKAFPKASQRSPRGPQEVHKRPQAAPRDPQEAARRLQEIPR